MFVLLFLITLIFICVLILMWWLKDIQNVLHHLICILIPKVTDLQNIGRPISPETEITLAESLMEVFEYVFVK